MKIKLPRGAQTDYFDDENTRYCLWATPKFSPRFICDPPSSDGEFVFARVELLKIKNGLIEEGQVLSADFYNHHDNGKTYHEALQEGFDVMPGAEQAARLLIKHNLAFEV